VVLGGPKRFTIQVDDATQVATEPAWRNPRAAWGNQGRLWLKRAKRQSLSLRQLLMFPIKPAS
jgi:signal-transduction protein with cAMP-binding, CBS, and nucleotidyltransferase domain